MSYAFLFGGVLEKESARKFVFLQKQKAKPTASLFVYVLEK